MGTPMLETFNNLKKKKKAQGFPGGLVVKGSGIVTAMVQVGSLARRTPTWWGHDQNKKQNKQNKTKHTSQCLDSHFGVDILWLSHASQSLDLLASLGVTSGINSHHCFEE